MIFVYINSMWHVIENEQVIFSCTLEHDALAWLQLYNE